MVRIKSLIEAILEPKRYIWIDAIIIRETPKAILIIFDGRKAWLPKAWLRHIRRRLDRRVIASPPKAGDAISIKISEHHWAKKFI